MVSAQYRVNQALRPVERALESVQPQFPDEIVGIRKDFDEDWSGELSLYVKVVLTDEASNPNTLGVVTDKIRRAIDSVVNPEQYGMFAYVNFRSKSEQTELKDPAWEL